MYACRCTHVELLLECCYLLNFLFFFVKRKKERETMSSRSFGISWPNRRLRASYTGAVCIRNVFFSRWKEKQVSFWRFGMAFSTPRNGSDGRRIWNALKVLFLLHRREGETDAAVTKSVSPVLSLSFQQAEREAFHRFSNKINDGEKKQKRKDKIQRLVRTVEIVNADSEFVFAAVDGLGDSFVVLAV